MDEPPPAATSKPCCVCDAPNGKRCTKFKSRHYCGKACQLVDWRERGHKAQCKELAVDFQDRMLDAIVPENKPKEAPPIVEAVAPAAGSTAAARAPVVRAETSAAAKAIALNDDTPDWRGTCGICLDLLPLGQGTQRFYECCCQKLCTECADKCSTTTDARSAERQSVSRMPSGYADCRSTWTKATPVHSCCSVLRTMLVAMGSSRALSGRSSSTSSRRRKDMQWLSHGITWE